MYWEEIVELIGTHGDEPLSTYPNQYNDSDEYVVYLYERGTVKTKYVHIDEFSEKIKDCLENILSTTLKIFKYLPHLVHQKVQENMMMMEMF